MRVMVLIKANEDTEAGVLPTAPMMNRYETPMFHRKPSRSWMTSL